MSRQNSLWKILILAIIFPAILISFSDLGPVIISLLIIIYYISLIFIFNPKIGLFLFLLFRPCFDILSDRPIISLSNISLNISSLVAIIIILIAIFFVAKNFKKIQLAPLKLPIIIFLLFALLSGLISFDLTISLAEFARLLSIFSIYALSFLLINSKSDLVQLIKMLIASTIVPGIFAFYQFFTGTGMTIPLEGIYNRIFGTFAHPNLLAYYLILPLILSLYIFLSENKKKVANLFYLIPAAILFILLALTYTRGAWLALIITFFIVGIFKYRAFLAIIVIILLSSYTFIQPINTRVNDLLKPKVDSSITWRLNLWQDAIKYTGQKPLLGYGTGTAKELILEQRGEQFGSSDPHNDYLKLTLENGLLGLLSYIWLILAIIYQLLTRYFLFPKQKTLLLIIISLTLAFYIMSFADNILRNTALQWAYWALLGAIFAVKKQTSPLPSPSQERGISHQVIKKPPVS